MSDDHGYRLNSDGTASRIPTHGADVMEGPTMKRERLVGWYAEVDWGEGEGWVGPGELRVFDTIEECLMDLDTHVHQEEGRVRIAPLFGGEWIYPRYGKAGYHTAILALEWHHDLEVRHRQYADELRHKEAIANRHIEGAGK